MKVINTSIWFITVLCVFAVLGTIVHSKGNNSENKNAFSNTVPQKHIDLNKRQIYLQKLQKLPISHGLIKDGLAAFLICERKQFKLDEWVPLLYGLVYWGPKSHITIQPPHDICQPGGVSWLSVTGPDGNEIPQTGVYTDFMAPYHPERAIQLPHGRFYGLVWPGLGLPKLGGPGTYTIEWHYHVHTGDSWWAGGLVSNEIQIEIVK